VRVTGLGYETEYFRLADHDVVHVSVPHVDPQVRAISAVWLPHIPPAPLCGLGREDDLRTVVGSANGSLCRACAGHLRDLDEWVRQAEIELDRVHAEAEADRHRRAAAAGRARALLF
jgi:hypothetical protein